jgi:hypothetical protein
MDYGVHVLKILFRVDLSPKYFTSFFTPCIKVAQAYPTRTQMIRPISAINPTVDIPTVDETTTTTTGCIGQDTHT